jgi:membrane-bound lytic murein transglycosylase B
MVLLAVFVENQAEVSVTLVILGAVLMALGLFGERVEGSLELGARGLKTQIVRSVRQEAKERGLSNDETEKAIATVRADLDVLSENESKRERRNLLDHILKPSGRADHGARKSQLYEAAKRRMADAYLKSWSEKRDRE